MNKNVAVDTLLEAVELTAKKLKNRKIFPISRDGNVITINKYKIIKEDNWYNIYCDDEMLYQGIYLLDAALSIVEYSIKKSTNSIDETIRIDKEYSKHYIDMQYYLHSYKHDISGNRFIYMDRFSVSRDRARAVKNKIGRYRLPI